MPYVPFHLYLIVFLTLAVGSQLTLYGLITRYFIRGEGNKTLKRVYLPAIFAALNSPLLFIHSDPQFFHIGFARTFVMMPFYAYETFSVAVMFGAALFFFLSAPFRITGRLKTRTSLRDAETPVSGSRRSFIKKGAVGLGAYAFAGSLYGIYDREDYRIDRVKLPLKDLPPQLDGFTISMISDIHSGMYMLEDDMLKYAEAVNNLNADMIVLPGDFVTSKNSEMPPLVKAFSGLKAKHGIYACLGNHDFFANPDYIAGVLRENGVTVLRNETEEVEINGAKLMLSGVDDGIHAKFGKVAYEAESAKTARILLCHKPYYFEKAVAGRFDVMLSGHTHGGQIVLVDILGVKITPAALASPYISGKYRLGNSIMYVSRGIGTIGLPLRVNCPPEITLFTLTKMSST